jgi:uncharacterized protein (TIGR02598 family)
MIRKSRFVAAFSLIEVTMAIGIAAFCLIAVFGLLPVGVQTNRNATSQTGGANILAAVIADMRATPNAATRSGKYHVAFGASQTVYFDESGQFATLIGPNSRYQLNVTFPPSTGLPYAATYATLKVTWPAAADPANATGSVEMFAAFDRH